MANSSNNPLDKLSQLKDFYIPDEPSMFPLAIGWWLLLVFLIVLAITLGVLLFKRVRKIIQKKRLQENILTGYKEIIDIYENNLDKHFLVSESSEYLKRFVKFILNDDEATILSGKNWTEFLQNKADYLIDEDVKKALEDGCYNPNIDFDDDKLIKFVNNWLESIIYSKKPYNKYNSGGLDV